MPASPAFAAHPDHTIDVSPHEGRVRVRLGGAVVADTERALALREADYPVALYVPREDCRMERFEATDRSTHCPFKGDARYWTLRAGDGADGDGADGDGADGDGADGETAENAAWAYDAPFDQVAAIAGHVAFYPDRVTIES